MTTDDRATDRHLSAEDLAVLAEGGRRDRATPAQIGHLSMCRRCMTLYAEAVRYRAAWLAMPEAFGDAASAAGPPPLRAKPGMHRPWAIAITASLAVVLGLLVAHLRSRPSIPAPVVAMLERASGRGLVLPGGEAGAAGSSSLYRSETLPPDDARTIEQLRSGYQKAPRATRDLYPLAAALVAAGETDAAGDFVREGLRRAPGDPRLHVLAGVVAYRRHDLEGAERALDEALRRAPHDPTALLDLGLIVGEARGPEAAASRLEEVIRRAPGSPLARRAAEALPLRHEAPAPR